MNELLRIQEPVSGAFHFPESSGRDPIASGKVPDQMVGVTESAVIGYIIKPLAGSAEQRFSQFQPLLTLIFQRRTAREFMEPAEEIGPGKTAEPRQLADRNIFPAVEIEIMERRHCGGYVFRLARPASGAAEPHEDSNEKTECAKVFSGRIPVQFVFQLGNQGFHGREGFFIKVNDRFFRRCFAAGRIEKRTEAAKFAAVEMGERKLIGIVNQVDECKMSGILIGVDASRMHENDVSARQGGGAAIRPMYGIGRVQDDRGF